MKILIRLNSALDCVHGKKYLLEKRQKGETFPDFFKRIRNKYETPNHSDFKNIISIDPDYINFIPCIECGVRKLDCINPGNFKLNLETGICFNCEINEMGEPYLGYRSDLQKHLDDLGSV